MCKTTSRRGLLLCATAAMAIIGLTGGCSSVARTPETIRNVTSDDLSVQQPVCLQQRGGAAPKAFVIRDAGEWKRFWGQGDEPPVINFDRSMIFCAYTSIGSEGPGKLEVWVQKFREKDDVVEVRVREVVNGSFPLSAAFSRAYHIVKMPKSDKPIKVNWRYLWGTRDETKEIEAKEWAPKRSNPLQNPYQRRRQTGGNYGGG